MRPEWPNHVWSYDFVEARTHDGRSLRLLTMIDEFTRESLAIRIARRLNSNHVIETLGDTWDSRPLQSWFDRGDFKFLPADQERRKEDQCGYPNHLHTH